MSSLISQAQPPTLTGTAATQRIAGASRAGATSSDAVAQTEEAAPVSIDATPSTPPASVLAEVQEAAGNWQALQAQGYEVHYGEDPASQRTVAELRDSQGMLVRRLTPSEAVALAAGEQSAQG